MSRSVLCLSLAVALLALVAACATFGVGLDPSEQNLHPANFDFSVAPGEDFNRFANGGWMQRTQIPGDEGSYGVFQQIRDRNDAVLTAILERAKDEPGEPGSNSRKIGDYFCSCLDEAQIEAAGLEPIAPLMTRIATIKDRTGLLSTIAALHRVGVGPLFAFTSDQDPGDQSRVIALAWQGGLGLPDRDDYFRDDERTAALREQYMSHVTTMLELLGDAPDAAAAGAAVVMDIETRLAQASMTRVEQRNPQATYNLKTLAEAAAATPGLDWAAYFRARGLDHAREVNLAQPEFFARAGELLAGVPIADWQTYLRWHLISDTASTLPAAFDAENFRFYSTVLRGVEAQRERERRCVSATSRALGEAVGELFVAETFSPEAKRRADAMVGNIKAAMRDRITTREWMGDETRGKALAKLDAITTKIGYPDEWRDYSALEVDRGPWAANVLRANAFATQERLDKIGKPVDRGEWGMSPQTVNAYYNPGMNEIVFPAGILQPPFFGEDQDDAVNYGAMGAIIGHEISHGFDDQGSQYDADGNLKNWWTEEDRQRFDARTQKLVDQFDGFEALPELHVNGRLTLGENIGDLGGLTIAYYGWKRSLGGQPAPTLDGFTGEQRFFLGWAQGWRSKMRDESLRVLVQTNPHAPANFRVLGPLRNMPEFHAAFDIGPGDPMYLAPDERADIW